MRFSVVLLPRAKQQLYDTALWWAEHRSRDQAARWLEGFEQHLLILEEDPERFPLAHENDAFPFCVRQLVYGLGRSKTHRALFEVRDDRVVVFAIRHLGQADVTPEDLA